MKPDSRLLPVAAFVLAGAAGAAFFAYGRFFNDDSLITIRYAENLLAGDGLVYNAGERHLGTTTPLWCLLLAACGALGWDLPSAATVLGVAAFAWAGAASVLALRASGASALGQWAGAVLLATSPLLLRWAGAGMEAPLYVAELATFLWLFRRERLFALGFVGGAMLLTRPESGLILAAAAILYVARERSVAKAWRVLPGFLLLVTPWLIGAGLYFGSPLPNSGFAKRLQVADWGPFLPRFGEQLALVPLLLPFALAGLARRVRDPAASLPVWALLVTVVGMQLGGLPGCPWYMVPPMYLVVLLAADGAGWAADAAATRKPPLAGVVLVVAVLGHVHLPAGLADARRNQQWVERLHAAVGRELQRIAPPDATVGVDNIGYIGYLSGLRVVDMLGLVDAEITEQLAEGRMDYALRSRRPEFVAIWVGRGNTWKYTPPDAWFDENGYEVVFRAPARPERPDGPAYTIFSRVGSR